MMIKLEEDMVMVSAEKLKNERKEYKQLKARYNNLIDDYNDLANENIDLENIINRDYEDGIFVEINEFWGDKMPMMAMEEAGEFIQAVSKYERYLDTLRFGKEYNISDKYEYEQNVVKEMADMMISIAALMRRYDFSKLEVEHAIETKLEKDYEL